MHMAGHSSGALSGGLGTAGLSPRCYYPHFQTTFSEGAQDKFSHIMSGSVKDTGRGDIPTLGSGGNAEQKALVTSGGYA